MSGNNLLSARGLWGSNTGIFNMHSHFLIATFLSLELGIISHRQPSRKWSNSPAIFRTHQWEPSKAPLRISINAQIPKRKSGTRQIVLTGKSPPGAVLGPASLWQCFTWCSQNIGRQGTAGPATSHSVPVSSSAHLVIRSSCLLPAGIWTRQSIEGICVLTLI